MPSLEDSFDYQVRLTLVARHPDEEYRVDAELVIEAPFLLRAELAIGENGSLTLGFDSGAEHIATPHPQFEAWSLDGHRVHHVTVAPGGERHWRR